MDFIDFIQEKKGAEPFLRYIKEKADRTITLAQVRQELSSIKDNLSEIIFRQFFMVFSESPSQPA
jgi:hypothetical protein